MNIYPHRKNNSIFYSVNHITLCKKHMAYLKKKYASGIIGVKDLPEDLLSINKDRGQEMIIQPEGEFIPDLYFYQRIFTKTNLSLIANQKSFYTINSKGYFRNPTDVIPFTYAKQYLSIPKIQYRYQGVTVTVYKRLFCIKLGFFGSKLSTRGLRHTYYRN